MDQIAFTLATILLGLMLLDYIVDKASKIIMVRKITKGINKLANDIKIEIEKKDEEEVDKDERN